MIESSFDKIKKIVKAVGGKVIIIEEGEPTFVVMDIEELISFDKSEKIVNYTESEDLVNKNVEIWKEKQNKRKLHNLQIIDDFKEEKEERKKS